MTSLLGKGEKLIAELTSPVPEPLGMDGIVPVLRADDLSRERGVPLGSHRRAGTSGAHPRNGDGAQLRRVMSHVLRRRQSSLVEAKWTAQP